MSVHFNAKHRKIKDFRGRIIAHEVSLGAIECVSATKAQAEEGIVKQVNEALADHGAPFVLFDWVDPTTVWIAHRIGSCWGYSILHRNSSRQTFGKDACALAGSCLGSLTKADAIERLKAHWYQCNIEPIVQGILGLCTARRQVECARCATVANVREAPYYCANPGCPSHEERAAFERARFAAEADASHDAQVAQAVSHV